MSVSWKKKRATKGHKKDKAADIEAKNFCKPLGGKKNQEKKCSPHQKMTSGENVITFIFYAFYDEVLSARKGAKGRESKIRKSV